MNIGVASEHSGLPAKTIRYYEDISLIRPGRDGNGYRRFTAQDVHKLRFLRRARDLGFKITECRLLLSLYEDTGRASSDVKDIAIGHLKRVDEKIAELQSLRDALGVLIESCQGDQRPECPILDDLSSHRNHGAEQ